MAERDGAPSITENRHLVPNSLARYNTDNMQSLNLSSYAVGYYILLFLVVFQISISHLVT